MSTVFGVTSKISPDVKPFAQLGSCRSYGVLNGTRTCTSAPSKKGRY